MFTVNRDILLSTRPCAVTYPEAVVKKAVDDRVDETVGHGQPVDAVVEADEEAFLCGGLVVGQFRMKVDDKHEGVQRQPAHGEQHHNEHQHLYHLLTHTSPAVLGKLLFKSNLLQLLLHFKSNKLLCKLLYRYFITSLKP